MRPSCNTQLTLYLFLTLSQILAAHNLTLVGSAGSSDALVHSQNPLKPWDNFPSRTLLPDPLLQSLSSLNGPWSSSRPFNLASASLAPSKNPWNPKGTSASIYSLQNSLSGPGRIGPSAFPSLTTPPSRVSGIPSSSPLDLTLRTANSTNRPTITAPPTPVSWIDGAPVFAANASLPPGYDSGVLSLAYFGKNCSMGGPPYGYNAKSCSCVNSNLKWNYDHATATRTTQDCQSSSNLGQQESMSCSYNTITEFAAPYVAPTDCCNRCDIRASAVQLIYWPPEPSNTTYSNRINPAAFSRNSSVHNITLAHTPPGIEPSGLVLDGFTFISPSVYVAYTGISAVASCIALGNSQITLNNVYTTTRAYPPQSLSSARCVGPDSENMWLTFPLSVGPGHFERIRGTFNGWLQVNYSELAIPPPPGSQLLSKYQSCFPTRSIDSSLASWLFMTPQLSIPSDVTDIDEQWRAWGTGTCTPVALGVLDPPRVLGRATGLRPSLITAASGLEGQYPPAAPAKTTLASAVETSSPSSAPLGFEPNSQIIDPTAVSNPAQNSIGNIPLAMNSKRPEEAGVTTSLPGPSELDPSTASDPKVEPVLPLNSGGTPSEKHDASTQNGVVGWSSRGTLINEGPLPPLDNNNNNVGAATEGSSTQTYTQSGNNIVEGTELKKPITLLPIEPTGKAPTIDGFTTGYPVVQHLPSSGGQQISQQVNNNQNPPENAATATSQAVSADHTVSDGVNHVVLDSSTYALQAPSIMASMPVMPSVEGHQIVQNSHGDLIVANSVILPGYQVIVAGHTISNAANRMVLDGNTQTLPPAPEPSPLLIDHQIVQVSNAYLNIGGQKLAPGGRMTVSGHVINYAKPLQAIVDGTSFALSPVSVSNPLVIAAQTIHRAPDGGLIIGSLTVTPGAQATVSGHVYSLDSSSSVIVDGSSTYSLPSTKNAYIVQELASSTPPGHSSSRKTRSLDQIAPSTSDSSAFGSANMTRTGPRATDGIAAGGILAAFKTPEENQKAAATKNDVWGFMLAGVLAIGIGALAYAL